MSQSSHGVMLETVSAERKFLLLRVATLVRSPTRQGTPCRPIGALEYQPCETELVFSLVVYGVSIPDIVY